MIYRKPLTAKKSNIYKKRISNFGGELNTVLDPTLVPANSSTLSYNLEGKSGALVNCGGIEDLGFDYLKTILKPFANNSKPIIGAWHFKRIKESGEADDKLVVMFEGFSVSYLSLNKLGDGLKPLVGASFTSVPNAVNYRLDGDDVIIFSSPTDEMHVWNGIDEPYIVENAPKMTSSCVHYERLFATVTGQRQTLWFSDDLDPTNWNVSIDDAGYIEMADEKGELFKVISFLDYLYIFRTYGITRVTAYTDQTQFSVSQLYVSSGKIYPDTVTVCGNKILFLSSDGLHSFDGLSTTKLLGCIDNLLLSVDNSKAAACYFSGKYFLSCKLDYKDNKKVLCENSSHSNNTLLVLNLFDKTFTLIRGVDVNSFVSIATEDYNKLGFCFNNSNSNKLGQWSMGGKIFDKTLPKCWVTPCMDFGSQEQTKLLKNIFLVSEHDCTVELDCDGKLSSFKLRGSKSPTRLQIGQKGYRFKISFLTNEEDIYISKAVVEYELLG